MRLYYFPKACFTGFLHMCEPRVVRFNFYYTFICAYICCAWKVFPLSFQNAWHHRSFWVEPGLSALWLPLDAQTIYSYWVLICWHFWVHGWTWVAEKAPLDLLYPTTSMKGRIRWSRSPLRIVPTYQLSHVSYSWPRLSQNPWGLGRAKSEWTSKPRVGYPL